MAATVTTPVRETPAFRPARRIASACLIALALAIGADALLFRTDLYTPWLEPDSSTGTFELTLYREREFAQRHLADNLVVTLGDSRFAYAPRLANDITFETGLVFRHAGVGGTDARSWYYMLRDLDPTARRFRAIVLGVPDYDDEDEEFNPLNDIRALHYCAARLRWRDIVPFALSFQDLPVKWQAFRGAVLKGMVLQSDILAFLSHPEDRIRKVRYYKAGYESWNYNYLESTRSMAGLEIDWKNWTVKYPPGADDNVHGTVEANLMRRDDPHDGRTARFRREWFGRILDRYRGSRTKIIFVRLPRGPIPRPAWLAHPTGSSIRQFAARPNVLLLDEHAFDSLEYPELFKDGVHLNRAGIAQFSPMLAHEIARLLRAGHAF